MAKNSDERSIIDRTRAEVSFHRPHFVWLNSLSAERHRDLIRARHCAGFTDFISVGGLAPAPGGVGMEAVVCRPRPHHSIAVDVDLARSSPHSRIDRPY